MTPLHDITVRQLLEVLLNPGHEASDPRVNAGVLALAAADAPAHDADLCPATVVDHQRTATVTAARVPAGLAGAQERVDDAAGRRVAVLLSALGVGPHRDVDLLQHGGLRAALTQTAPADDGRRLAGVPRAAARHADGPDVPPVLHGGVQRQDGHVVVQGPGVEAAVPDHPPDLLLNVAGLRVGPDVVVTETHREPGHVPGAHVGDAMGGREDVSRVDEGTATELPSAVKQRRDPRPLSEVGVLATDNPLLVLVAVLGAAARVHGLRGGRGSGQRRGRRRLDGGLGGRLGGGHLGWPGRQRGRAAGGGVGGQRGRPVGRDGGLRRRRRLHHHGLHHRRGLGLDRPGRRGPRGVRHGGLEGGHARHGRVRRQRRVRQHLWRVRGDGRRPVGRHGVGRVASRAVGVVRQGLRLGHDRHGLRLCGRHGDHGRRGGDAGRRPRLRVRAAHAEHLPTRFAEVAARVEDPEHPRLPRGEVGQLEVRIAGAEAGTLAEAALGGEAGPRGQHARPRLTATSCASRRRCRLDDDGVVCDPGEGVLLLSELVVLGGEGGRRQGGDGQDSGGGPPHDGPRVGGRWPGWR